MPEFAIIIRTNDVRAAFEAGFRISQILNELENIDWDVDL